MRKLNAATAASVQRKRIIAQAEERQRAREEREAAEAKEANQVAVGR
jgi:hypothetical protein